MKRSCLCPWLPGGVMGLLLYSCQSLDGWEQQESEKGTLAVQTRSAAEESIAYPMKLYAFSEEGESVFSQEIQNEEETVQLQLKEGSYRVVAVAGYSEGYELPDGEQEDECIRRLEDAPSSSPLMMGMADVRVSADKKSKLEITLSYYVTALDVVLTGLSLEAAGVTVSMTPFYASVNWRGEYADAGHTLEFPCTKDASGRWSTRPTYVFPGSGKETVLTITIQWQDGTETVYGYTWKEAPQAGRPYHLKGDYSGGLDLDSSFIISGWLEAEEVPFEFGSVLQSDEDNPSVPDFSDLPEAGTIWNDALVVDIDEADESGVDVLLMSLDEWSIVTDQVPELISGYSVNGLAGWRLPTYEEAKLLRSSFSGENRIAVNERIAAYDDTLWGLDGEERYLCNKDGIYYSFVFSGGSKLSKAGGVRSYYARLVKTYRINR